MPPLHAGAFVYAGGVRVRLWSLHPQYLDAKGLVALWREGLLAQAVLRGQTRGYKHHPQLDRFRSHPTPLAAINAYLVVVHAEATARGYAFDANKIDPPGAVPPINVSQGQLDHEWRHLLMKLAIRDLPCHGRWRDVERPACHPLFIVRSGGIAAWERATLTSNE